MDRRAWVAAVAGLLAQVVIVGSVLAAEPTPTPGGANDPRSPGQGPGLVGDPAFAIVVVVFVAAASVVATLLYVRLSRPPGGPAASR